MANYGKELKYQREIRNLTQSDLARNTGLNQQMISYWENERGLPNIHFCVILADYYEITLDELVGRDIRYKTNVTNSQTITVHGGNVKISQNNK